MTLSIPQHRDPVARFALVACALALVWLAITSAMPPAQAQEQPQTIILIATPTALPLTAVPAVAPPPAAAPTAVPPTPVPPTPIVVVAPAPVQEEAPHERPSDKAGPGQKIGPPVVRH